MTFYSILSPQLGSPSISILLQVLVNQYLSDSYCLTFVLDKPLDFIVNESYSHIIPDNSSVESLTDQLLQVSERGCSDYIVYMREPQDFMAAFDRTSRFGNIRRSDRKIIILPYSDDANGNLLDLFSMKESTFIANLLVVIPNNESESNCDVYDLVTHEFISLVHDQAWYLDQWDSCSQKFVRNANLFPHNIVDLKGRIVRVASFTYKPYSLLNLDKAVVASQRDGMEIRIVDEFCRWANCTIEIVAEEIDQWGEIFENGSGIGVIGDVVIDRADMGISALYSWYEEFLYLDFSAAGIRSGITSITPSPRLLATWEMPLMPFTWFMWYAVLTTFILASIGLTLASGSTKGVFLTTFAMMISQSQQDKNVSWRIRGITGWMLGASLIIVSAYGAGLASTFTVPRFEASIDTVQDLVDRKLEWGATHDAWIFSLTLSPEPLIKQLVSQFRIYTSEELKRKSFTRSMGFSIEKLPAGYFAIGDYITKEALRDLTIMLEDFYYEQCVVMMRKSSVYTEKMTAFIGRLHQSGLLLAWETQVALKFMNFEVQLEVKLSRSKTDSGITTALASRHVVGVYILYLTGVVISILVFIGECLTKKIAKEARRNNI